MKTEVKKDDYSSMKNSASLVKDYFENDHILIIRVDKNDPYSLFVNKEFNGFYEDYKPLNENIVILQTDEPISSSCHYHDIFYKGNKIEKRASAAYLKEDFLLIHFPNIVEENREECGVYSTATRRQGGWEHDLSTYYVVESMEKIYDKMWGITLEDVRAKVRRNSENKP